MTLNGANFGSAVLRFGRSFSNFCQGLWVGACPRDGRNYFDSNQKIADYPISANTDLYNTMNLFVLFGAPR